MKKKYTYSFIIPHKNRPELLNRCLDSIPMRDDIQIIVVDDNSDYDKKPSVGRKDVQIVMLNSEQSKGAGRARNIGMGYAKGKWLLFADADDYYNQNFLKILDNYVAGDEDAIFFNAEYRDGDTGKKLKSLHFMNEIAQYNGTHASLETIRFHHNVPWTKMVARDFLNKNNIYFEETPNGNDILFSIFVGYLGNKFKVEKTPLYVYLKNSGSLVTDRVFDTEKKLCRIIHTVKRNSFYSFINHSEWKVSIVNQILYEIKLSRISDVVKFLLAIANKIVYIHKSRKEWVQLLDNSRVRYNYYMNNLNNNINR